MEVIGISILEMITHMDHLQKNLPMDQRDLFIEIMILNHLKRLITGMGIL